MTKEIKRLDGEWCAAITSLLPIAPHLYWVAMITKTTKINSGGFLCLSFVPRPHLQGGKGSGELGQSPWTCAEEFPRANEIAALAQSCDKLTAGMQHCYTCCKAIEAIQFSSPIRFKVCFTTGCYHMQMQP